MEHRQGYAIRSARTAAVMACGGNLVQARGQDDGRRQVGGASLGLNDCLALAAATSAAALLLPRDPEYCKPAAPTNTVSRGQGLMLPSLNYHTNRANAG